ncbi:MAG: hypothetical protein IJU14_04465 [Clostridia bacterium]|nr:hypothetical protein [Clostridia bacterium]
MIPKIIHYCWFGNGEKNDVIKKCIESWKVNCPDYEIMEWNESNFDVNAYAFTKEAYENKKWAFVSDVARLEALIQYGGFYMDTDVEILQKDIFNKYRQYQNVFAFETERRIATGLFCGCEKNSKIFSDFLACYQTLTFEGGWNNLNTTLNTPVLEETYPSLIWNNKAQLIGNTYFLDMNEYGKIMKHYAMHSWLDNKTEFKLGKETRFKKALRNPKIYSFLKKHFGNGAVNAYEFFSYDLLDMGVWYFIKRKFSKKKK